MEIDKKQKPGYKHTELGLIPVEWELFKLDAIGSFMKGKGIQKDCVLCSGIPCIRYGEIYTSYNHYFYETISFIDEATANESCLINKGDLLFAGSGETAEEIGKCVAYLGDGKAFAGGDIIILRPKNANSMYLSYILNHSIVNRQKAVLGQGNSIVHIYPNSLSKIKIPLPPLPEQKKIAEILSTWDRAIETTEKLIEAKNKLKKGLMQQLLTGKKRFKEFEGKWGNTKIKNIANQVIARNTSNENYHVLSCTKYSGLVDSLKYFGKQIFSNDLSTYKVVKRNQFAYATNHIEEGSIGLQNIFDNALISPMYTVFETNNEIDNDFLYAVLKTEEYRKVFESNTSGSINRRGGLRWNDFSNIQIPKPSVEEQSRISGFLSIINNEITLLTSRLASLKQQKKGLMQALLTGRVRVRTIKEVKI